MAEQSIGKVVAIIGPVLDIQFPEGKLPAIYNAVHVQDDGKETGEPIDFYQAEVGPTGELDLGTHELKAGANELTITVTGANPQAVKGYMFGLDYLVLKPVGAGP